jgi:D-glycero-alpha-D-manno-heptose-7-phosphate kinase
MEQGGCVCNVAVARYATVELTARARGVAIADEGGVIEADDPRAFARDGRAELAKAVLRRAQLSGVELRERSDFPYGAGLGGSSAAGVALAGAVAEWCGETLDRAALAERSRAVEVEELGIAGGRQDHYAAAFGGALGLWFGDGVRVRRIPLTPGTIAAVERRCTVVYTGQSRISGENITAVLDAYRAREPRVTSALARMRELAEMMIAALERESLDDVGRLVGEHWEHQRALHPAISTPLIERVLEASRRAGALGGKALGASGGGCVLVIAPDEYADDVRRAVHRVAEPLAFRVDGEGLVVRREAAS